MIPSPIKFRIPVRVPIPTPIPTLIQAPVPALVQHIRFPGPGRRRRQPCLQRRQGSRSAGSGVQHELARARRGTVRAPAQGRHYHRRWRRGAAGNSLETFGRGWEGVTPEAAWAKLENRSGGGGDSLRYQCKARHVRGGERGDARSCYY